MKVINHGRHYYIDRVYEGSIDGVLERQQVEVREP